MKKTNIIFERNSDQIYWRVSGDNVRFPIPIKIEVDGKTVSVDVATEINKQIDIFTQEQIDKKNNE